MQSLLQEGGNSASLLVAKYNGTQEADEVHKNIYIFFQIIFLLGWDKILLDEHNFSGLLKIIILVSLH